VVPESGVFPAVLMLICPTVGALIASRRSRNPIGWLFCLMGFVVIVLSFATAYASDLPYRRRAGRSESAEELRATGMTTSPW
jgi:hypothetical protein